MTFIVAVNLYGDTYFEEITSDCAKRATDSVLWFYREILEIRGAIIQWVMIKP